MSKGGNFAAIHAASAGYLDKAWAPYTQSLGATFDHHPKRQNATFLKLASHPSTDPYPDSFVIEEEVYSFTSDPRKLGAKVVVSVDDNSYKGAFFPNRVCLPFLTWPWHCNRLRLHRGAGTSPSYR